MPTLRQELVSESTREYRRVSERASEIVSLQERVQSQQSMVELTVKSAKSTVQYGNRRGTRESTESAIVNTVSVGSVCNRTIVIPTV
jgi:hypothetical protein